MTRVTFRSRGTEQEAVVAVDVSDARVPELPRMVAALFPPLLWADAPLENDADVLVRSTAGRGFSLREGAAEEGFDTVPELLSALEFRLLNRLLAPWLDCAHLHASGAVVARGAAILCIGPSGSGKSSLALALAHLGLPLLGDDLVILDGDGRVRGFPRLVKVHSERVTGWGEDPRATLAHDPQDPEVWWGPDLPGGWASGPVRAGLVAAVRFQPGADTRLEPLTPVETLRHLLGNTLESGLPAEGALDRYAVLAEDARAFSMDFGDAGDAARSLVSLAKGGHHDP